MIMATLETKIANLEADIFKETKKIEAAIAEHQIGHGHWQRRHFLECQLRVARALRDAISEVQP